MDIVKPKTLILYHADCLDGMASAWIARDTLGVNNIALMACTYNDPVPDLTGYDNLYILDFSWPPAMLLPAIIDLKYVVMLDHHKTAIEEWHGQELPEGMTFKWALDQSGIGLAWDFFNEDRRLPPLLELLQHRDLWHKDVDGCMEVGAAVYSMGVVQKGDFAAFSALMFFTKDSPKYISSLVEQGEAILRNNAQLITSINKRCGKDIYLNDKIGRFVNINYELASQCGDQLCETYDFVVMYEDLLELNRRKFSLRSRKGNLDVSDLAATYGGGGHENAAGFYTDIETPLPF